MKHYFISATGTDIGKTLFTAALTWQLRARGESVLALKPLASGFDPEHSEQSDAASLLAAMEKPISALPDICPWRFRAPLAPDLAAAQENRSVPYEDMLAFCKRDNDADITLIEGVGGIMSPITPEHTVLGWIKALNIPVILVSGSYVGAISHTLTALEVMKTHNITLQSLVISASDASPMSVAATADAIKAHGHNSLRCCYIPRLDSTAKMWKMAPDVTQSIL